MIVVSDTSPITNLAAINQLDILRQLYGDIIIPHAVYHEMVSLSSSVHGTYEVQTFSWIKTYQVIQQDQVNQLLEKLDQGEAEGIILALELEAELLLIDERKGRKIAKSLGLNVTGILGILIEAKRKKLVNKIKPILKKIHSP